MIQKIIKLPNRMIKRLVYYIFIIFLNLFWEIFEDIYIYIYDHSLD
jgi:hypothetical protein